MKDETKLALLQRDVETIKKSQDRMEIALAALQGIFWTTKGHEEFVADVNKRFTHIENQVDRQQGARQYISPILSGILTLVITSLVIFFLQHAH